MQERVLAIVNYLIRRSRDDRQIHEEELIEHLQELGFDFSEIETAFEIFSTGPEKTESSGTSSRPVWVFGPKEETKLSLQLRGKLLELYHKSYLTTEEMNEIVFSALKMDKNEVDLPEFGYLVSSVIKDNTRLKALLSSKDHETKVKIIT